MSTSPAIELRSVSISFEDKHVLSDVSFALETGETLMLLGVTGSGKSVLLKLLMGLLKPDAGQVLIEGRDLVPLTEEELQPIRKRMGIVFQEGALFDSLSVYENVAYRLRGEHQEDEAAIERRVREVLRFVEMEPAIEKMPAGYSLGACVAACPWRVPSSAALPPCFMIPLQAGSIPSPAIPLTC